MKLLGRDIIEEFKAKHAAAREPLDQWVAGVRSCSPKHFIKLKQTFGSADFVSPYTVWDVKGNQIRIVAKVSYQLQVVIVMNVLTHDEYDEGRWRK